MGNIFKSIIIAVSFALPLAIAHASLAVTPVVTPKPDPKVDELSYFQGNWMCQTKEASAVIAKPENAFSWKMRRELNNFWYIGQTETAQRMMKTHETMGYNTLTKKFGRTILTNEGSFINLLSDGWNKDTFTWEGSSVQMSQQQKEVQREVIVKKSDREFEVTNYTQEPTKKEWQPIVKATCKKSTGLFRQR